jgi:hypothetical protein
MEYGLSLIYARSRDVILNSWMCVRMEIPGLDKFLGDDWRRFTKVAWVVNSSTLSLKGLCGKLHAVKANW